MSVFREDDVKHISIVIDGGRSDDFTAEYIVNEDGERLIDTIIKAQWWMSFGDIRGKHSDISLKLDAHEVTRTDLSEAKIAAYAELYGVLDAETPWIHLKGDIDPLAYAYDTMRIDEGVEPLDGESTADFMLRAGGEDETGYLTPEE